MLQPFIQVSVAGRPVSSAFYSRLVSASIHDAPGQEADTVELTFDDGDNMIAMPEEGAELSVSFGFRDGAGAFKMGVFIAERTVIAGGADGQFLTISGRSADMRSDIKEPLSEHFEDQTVGEIVEQLAGRHGYGVKVDADFASLRLPYIARFEQGATDFLTRLGDRIGAIFAVKDRKFLLVKRGGLPAVTIARGECESWSFEVEPRPRYGSAEAAYFDRANGRLIFEEHSTGLGGARKRLRTIYASPEEARAAARAEGERLARCTGTGSLTLAGRPDIMADQSINVVGFRAEVNGLWRCAGVDHVYDDTYRTTIELEAPETGKT